MISKENLQMKTFRTVKLFTIFCLSAFILLVATIAEVHAQDAPESAIKVEAVTGDDIYVTRGDEVSADFTATEGGLPVVGARLTITHHGLSNVSHRNNSIATTTTRGTVTVTGIIDVDQGAWIQAEWKLKNKTARTEFQSIPKHSPVLIVVNEPDPKEELGVGSTFEQKITIENRDPTWPTYPVTAWQMDIVFNPNILRVTNVTEGDFLEDSKTDDDEALFLPFLDDPEAVNAEDDPEAVNPDAELAKINLKGRINASQALYNTTSGVALDKGESKTLLTIEFKVLEYAEEALGIHNVLILTNSDTNNDKRTPDRISYAILVKDVFVATVHYSYSKYDVNQDGKISMIDLVIAASSIGTHNLRADVNDDDIVNVLDLVEIAKRIGEEPGKTSEPHESIVNAVNDPPTNINLAPSASRNIDPTTIQSWIASAQIEDDGSEMFKRGISNLKALLNSKVPTKTKLLLNYPNPFNPETWIPYQLAESSDVTVTIYSMSGMPIRTLKLGHQSAGTYINKNQAAYWDGRNELGEQSASGVYFYVFTAGKFSATGKMLIRK